MLLDDKPAKSGTQDFTFQNNSKPDQHVPASLSKAGKSKKPGKIKVQLTLFCINTLLLVSFFSVGANKSWFKKRIISYWEDFRQQKNQLDPEQRMAAQFGNRYTVSRSIAALFHDHKDRVLLLMPPTAYLAKKGIDYKVPEPAVFYYYTGLKTLWPDSKEAKAANWYLRTNEQHQLMIDRVNNARELDSVRALYRLYKTDL